jgi:drug/metabolite transporter (DMT)-like permease
MAFLRYGLTALPVLVYLHLKYGMRQSLRDLASDFHLLLGLAAFSVAIPNITQNMGLWRNESSSLTAILQASSPAFSVLLAFLILREGVGWKKVAGITLAIFATFLLAAGDLDFQGSTFEGNLLVLASSVSYGFAGIFAKNLLSRRPPGIVVSWSFLLGALLILPAVPLDAGLPLRLAPEGWAILLFLAFLPGFLASFLFYWVLQGQDLSRLVFFVYLIPVMAAIPSVLFLGETVTTQMAVLGLLIILGVAIAQYEAPADRMRLPQA